MAYKPKIRKRAPYKWYGGGSVLVGTTPIGPGPAQITVQDVDAVPSFTLVDILQFDQDDGITISEPVAGTSRVDLLLLKDSGGNGIVVRTAAKITTNRSLVQPAAGITISNSDGVAGNPTFDLANDLAALEALGNGIPARTAADTWASRTLTGTTNRIAVTNGDGVGGNPTFDIGSDVVTIAGSQTLTNKTLTTPTISGAITFPDNVRQTFNPGANDAGLNVGALAGDPSTPSNGDIWYDSTANELTARINGVNVNLGAAGSGLPDPGSNGMVARTGAGTTAARTLTGTANRIVVTNGDGSGGNPSFDIGTNVVTLTDTQSLTNKTITSPTIDSSGTGAQSLTVTSASGATVPMCVFTATINDTATGDTIVQWRSNSSGSAANGFGQIHQYYNETTTTDNVLAAEILVIWTTATHASRQARMQFLLNDANGSRECLRLQASGTAAQIGFLGATPIVRQTSGANFTNNVTSGGTDDQVQDFTDLNNYANDAITIRQDIYQLARKLKQVNDALRSYGLLT